MRSNFLLIITALIWGVAFAAQSAGMAYVGPATFNAVRFLLGAVSLLPLVLLPKKKLNRTECRTALTGGVCCGIVLGASSLLQQFGLVETTVGKAGFITSLYIVMVPLLGLAAGRRVAPLVWFSVVLALLGMYLLCMAEGMSVNRGDFYIFISAIGFSFHILMIDYVSPKTNGIMVSCVQFWVAGAVSAVLMAMTEAPAMAAVLAAKVPILYAGVMSCGIAYTLQIVAQRDVNPTIASLILSLEAVFSLLAGWFLLGQRLSSKELTGCVFVLAAILFAQIPPKVFIRGSDTDPQV